MQESHETGSTTVDALTPLRELPLPRLIDVPRPRPPLEEYVSAVPNEPSMAVGKMKNQYPGLTVASSAITLGYSG